MRRMEQASREEKTHLEARIKEIEGKLSNVGDRKKEMETRLGKMKEEIGRTITDLNELIKKQREKLDSTMLSVTEEMDMVKI